MMQIIDPAAQDDRDSPEFRICDFRTSETILKFPDATQRLLVFPSPIHPNPLKDVIAHRIADLHTEICTLNKRRNSLLPICRLPPELLSTIFRKCIATEPPVTKKGQFPFQLTITSVCTHWRAVALDCPLLWTNIVHTAASPHFTRAQLALSRTAPLTIKTRGSASASLYDALDQVDRLQHVSLQFAWDIDSAPAFSRWPENEISSLKSLELDRLDSVPTGFMQKGAPSLRRLKLTLCKIPWHEIPLNPNLTHLVLSQRIDGARPSPNSLISSFSSLPRLQVLELVEFLPEPEEAYPKSHFTLSHIKNLVLCDRMDAVGTFLSHSEGLPVSARSSVTVRHPWDDNFMPTKGALESITMPSPKRQPDVYAMRLQRQSLHALKIELWITDTGADKRNRSRTQRHFETLPKNPSRTVIFDNCDEFRRTPSSNLFTMLLRKYNTDSLEHLAILSTALTQATWSETIAQFPNLKTLELQSDTRSSSPCFMLARFVKAIESQATGDALVPFRSLSSLILEEVDMKRCPEEFRSPTPLLCRLINALSSRAHSHPLQLLQLEDCEVSDRESCRVLTETQIPGLSIVYEPWIFLGVRS